MKIAIIGAGNIGSAAAHMLVDDQHQVLVIDSSNSALCQVIRDVPGVSTGQATIQSPDDLAYYLDGYDAVLNAGPYFLNKHVVDACAKANASYFDLTEDVESASYVKQVAAGRTDSSTIFMPQCGLAPGFVSIAAGHLARDLAEVHEVKLRVGALPVNPTNALKYNLTWSVDGLINECAKPGIAVRNGQPYVTTALEELENITLDGIEYEAFNTSGGIGSLYTMPARVVNYKTLRYPGHRDLLKFAFHELMLISDVNALRELLLNVLPTTKDDVVVIRVSASGLDQDGKLVEHVISKRIRSGVYFGRFMTAIQVTTAAAACAMITMLDELKPLAEDGFVRQEQVPYDRFLLNRFGQAYA